VGGVIAPQLFQTKWAHNGYKNSFIICTVCVAAAIVVNQWLWGITAQSERDVHRVRRLRIAAKKNGEVYAGADVNVDDLAPAVRAQRKDVAEV
jgi:hypothetical protein